MPKKPMKETQFFRIFKLLSTVDTPLSSREISDILGISFNSVRRELAELRMVGKLQSHPIKYSIIKSDITCETKEGN